MTERQPLFDDTGTPSNALGSLLALDPRTVEHDNTRSGVNNLLQQHWRQHDTHQGDIPDASPITDVDQAKQLLIQLGILGEVRASNVDQPRKYGLLFGAYVTAIRKRLALLLKEWEGGLRFENLVLLGSERAAHPQKETDEILNDHNNGVITFKSNPAVAIGIQNEASIMSITMDQAKLPDKLASTPITKVVCPPRDSETKRDPGAADTLQHWLDTEQPEPGTCIGVYSQPGITHLQVVARKLLASQGFDVEIIGYDTQAGKEVNIPKCLDTVAKVVYEEATE